MLELFSLTSTGGSYPSPSPRSSPSSSPSAHSPCLSEYYATLAAQYLSTHRIAGLCARAANHHSHSSDDNSSNDNRSSSSHSSNSNSSNSLTAAEDDGERPLGYIKHKGLDKDKEQDKEKDKINDKGLDDDKDKGKDKGLDKGLDKDKCSDPEGCPVRDGVFDDALLTLTEPYQTADW